MDFLVIITKYISSALLIGIIVGLLSSKRSYLGIVMFAAFALALLVLVILSESAPGNDAGVFAWVFFLSLNLFYITGVSSFVLLGFWLGTKSIAWKRFRPKD